MLRAILRKAPWITRPYMAAIQDIESLPARSCDMDTSQIYSSFSGGGSLDKPLIHGKTSSKFRAASVQWHGDQSSKGLWAIRKQLFFDDFFSMTTLHLVVLMILEGVDRNVDSQVTATIVHY